SPRSAAGSSARWAIRSRSTSAWWPTAWGVRRSPTASGSSRVTTKRQRRAAPSWCTSTTPTRPARRRRCPTSYAVPRRRCYGDAMGTRDPRVDAYLEPLPDWQRETLTRVREALHRADPEMTETIKRTVQPYFVLQGNVAAFLAARDHVNVFVYDGCLVPD